MRAARTFAAETAGRAQYIEVRYEDLVTAPEATLRRLFAFLSEDWEAAVLDYHEHARELADESSADAVTRPLSRSAIGRWQRDLAVLDRPPVKEEIGGLLVELGYATDVSW